MIVYGITAEQASPSSRRAWIEITRFTPVCINRAWIEMSLNHSFQTLAYVALLAEGVDRNMRKLTREHWRTAVALLAEGVDRNMLRQTVHGILYSRPPRGGRG